jgi:uncharacterized LabA/DUF88 family protein
MNTRRPGRRKEMVLCLVDSQNIYYTPSKAGRRIDYFRLKKAAARGRDTLIIAYLVSDPVVDQTSFMARLHRFGYSTKIKVMYLGNGEVQNSDWDAGIIEDAKRLMSGFETLVLVSGDGDFAELVGEIKSRGKRVEVMCFEEDLSISLAKVADRVTYLDDSVLMGKGGARWKKIGRKAHSGGDGAGSETQRKWRNGKGPCGGPGKGCMQGNPA